MKRILPWLLIFLAATPAYGYITIRSNNGAVVHWAADPTFVINPAMTNTTSINCVADPAATIRQTFELWLSDPNLAIGATYGGASTSINFCGMCDGGTELVVLAGGTFCETNFNEKVGDAGCDIENNILFSKGKYFSTISGSILAITVDQYEVATGVMKGSDIVFNDGVSWSDGLLPGCTISDQIPARYAFEAVITHELGHFFGLDHSFVGFVGNTVDYSVTTTMYPIYSGALHWQEMLSLEQDDRAGIYYQYPGPSPGWGWITGVVRHLSGENMFGVHVVAVRQADKTPAADALTGPDGAYVLAGLTAGDYYAYAESPEIDGTFFPAFISYYFDSAEKAPFPMLYNAVNLTSYDELSAGSTTFDRATLVTVAADTAAPGFDFIYPAKSRHHHHDGGGCAVNPDAGAAPSADLPAAFVLSMLLALMFRSLRKTRPGCAQACPRHGN